MTLQARQVVIHRVLFPLVLPRHAVALPVSLTTPSTVVAARTYFPLAVISLLSLFLLIVFSSVKVLYMKHRRIGTIHSPPTALSLSTTSDLSSTCRPFASVKSAAGPATWYRGLLVGCFGSPTWETNMVAKLTEGAWPRGQRREASFTYQLHRNSKRRSIRSIFAPLAKSKNSTRSSSLTRSSTSFFSFSSGVDEHTSAASSVPSSTKAICPPQHTRSRHDHVRFYNHGGGTLSVLASDVPKIGRRASPSSIRLIDGSSHGDPVEYSFLSGTPPKSTATSPLMGTRDSLQLSRCSLKYDRKPVPPLPPLPSFSPLDHSKTPVFYPIPVSEYLSLSHLSLPEKKTSDIPALHTNDGVSISKVPCHKRKLSLASDVTFMELEPSSFVHAIQAPYPLRDPQRKPKHKRSLSHKSVAVEVLVDENSRPFSLSPVDEHQAVPTARTDSRCTPGSSRSSIISKKPLKPCLRQSSIVSNPSFCSPDNVPGLRFTFTPSISEISIRSYSQGTGLSTDDQVSLRTPISDIDIGMLGLDRFRWNDEIKELEVRPSHSKKDSFALDSELL